MRESTLSFLTPRCPVRAFAALLLLAALTGCNGCEEGPPADAIDRSPTERPGGVDMEFHIVGGSGELARIKQLFTNPLVNAALPGDIVSFLNRYLELPGGIAAKVQHEGNAVLVTGLREHPNRPEEALSLEAMALSVSREPGVAHPFGESVELRRGGPAGGRWLRDEGAQRASSALFDDIIVTATNDAIVEEFAPFLAYTALPREMPPGVHLLLGDPIVSGMKRWVELETAERVGPLRASIRQARADRDEAPVLDPDALLTYAEQTVLRLAAYLPDLRELTFSAQAGDDGLILRATAKTAPRSPLRRAVEAAPTGTASALRGFRDDTAFGIYSPGPAPDGASMLSLIGALSSSPLSEADRAVYETAFDAFAANRDGASLVGLGAGIDGPWFAYSQKTNAPVPLANIAPAFSHSLVRGIGAHLSGCETWPETLTLTTEGALPLCRQTSLALAQTPQVFALALGRTPRPVADTYSASLIERTTGTLATFPEVERQTEGDRDVIFGVLFTPARVIPAVKLLGPLRDMPLTTSTTTVAPIVLTLSRTEDAGLALETTLSIRALTHLSELVTQLMM